MIKRLKEQNIERRKYQADMQRSYNIHNSAFMAEISLDDLDKLISVCEAAMKYRDIAAKGIMHNQTEFEAWSDLDDSIAALEE